MKKAKHTKASPEPPDAAQHLAVSGSASSPSSSSLQSMLYVQDWRAERGASTASALGLGAAVATAARARMMVVIAFMLIDFCGGGI